MRKLYVAKDKKGRFMGISGNWTKDINKAELYYAKSSAKEHGIPVQVNTVAVEET